MTFLFVGGEDSDFSKVGGCTVDTATTAARDTGKTRCSLKVSSTTITDGWVGALTAASSLFWLTARSYAAIGNGTCDNAVFIAFNDGANRRLMLCNVQGNFTSTAFFKLVKRNAAGTHTILATSGICPTTLTQQKFDIYVDYQAAGNVKVYLDGALIINYSGDVTTDGATTLDSFSLGQFNSSVNFSSSQQYWSEVVAATTDTRSLRLVTLPPDADGTTTDWSNTFASIDEITFDDLDVNASPTANQVMQYSVSPGFLTSDPAIEALVIKPRILKGAAGPTQVQGNVRTGGSDFFTASSALGTTYAPIHLIFLQNPNTTNPWQASEINDAGFEIGLKSIT
jgi:hypothetical protein